MRKLFVLGMVVVLVGGALGVSADAKKKKRKKLVPVELKLFLRRDDCGEGTADNPHLSVVDAEDGNACGNFLSGAPNEVLIATGVQPVSYVWPALDGMPFKLHAAKPITGEITLRPFTPGAGVGEVILEVTLNGTTAGQTVELGSAEESWMPGPLESSHTAQFTIKPPKKLNKKRFTGLELTTLVRGQSTPYGFHELDDPPSFLSLSQLVTRKKALSMLGEKPKRSY